MDQQLGPYGPNTHVSSWQLLSSLHSMVLCSGSHTNMPVVLLLSAPLAWLVARLSGALCAHLTLQTLQALPILD